MTGVPIENQIRWGLNQPPPPAGPHGGIHTWDVLRKELLGPPVGFDIVGGED